jgi:integrase/recombinase XerD
MIESIFQLKWVVSRHQQAPLLKEREQFLAHCKQQGTSPKALHNMAPELIAVVRFLRMEELREVSLEKIKLAAEAWAAEQRSNPRARSYAKSASYFIFAARVPVGYLEKNEIDALLNAPDTNTWIGTRDPILRV